MLVALHSDYHYLEVTGIYHLLNKWAGNPSV